MFEALQQDPSLIQITIVIILLIAVAVWRQLKEAAMAMAGIYLLYIVFIIISAPASGEKSMDEIQMSSIEELPTIQNEPIIEQPVDSIEEEIDADRTDAENEASEVSIDRSVVAQQVEPKVEEHAAELEISKPQNQNENADINRDHTNPIQVVSMAFGREMVNRELIGGDSIFTLSDSKIYTLTKIRNRNDKKVFFHKWYHEGKLRSKIMMEVGRSYNWRTWSYINVKADMTGDWQVFLADSLNVNYDSLSFKVLDNNFIIR